MRTAPALVVAGLSLLVLAGCVPDDGPVIPSPLLSSTPIFASDEEALAAAEEAYGAYQSEEDAISARGGAEPDSIDQVATGAALEAAKTGFRKYATAGYRSVGSTGYELTQLQQYSPYAEEGLGIVSAYLCMDLSNLDVVDAQGASVVSRDRPNLQSFEVSFDLVDNILLLSSRDPWDGEGICVE